MARAPVILEMDMNCYGCAKKIQKAIKKMPGVERVSAYVDTRQVVVEGEADAAALKARLEYKLKKAVTIVSDGAAPPPPPPPDTETQTQTPLPFPPGPTQGVPPLPPHHYPYVDWNPTTTYGPRYMPNDGPATFSDENPNAPHYYPYGDGNTTTTYDPRSRYMPNDGPATFSDENPNACSIQ